MKRHSMFAAMGIAALAIAMPASAGPLGGITGAAGGGVLGTLGGTLSSPASTVGIGAGSMFGAGGQLGGQLHRPDLTIEQLPVRRATQAIDSAAGQARSKAGNAIERVESTQLPSLPSSAGTNAAAQGGASAGPASANAEASAGARASY